MFSKDLKSSKIFFQVTPNYNYDDEQRNFKRCLLKHQLVFKFEQLIYNLSDKSRFKNFEIKSEMI